LECFVGLWWVEQLCHGLDAHVAVLELPFVVGFEQHGPDEANDRRLGWKDADDIRAAFDWDWDCPGLVDTRTLSRKV